MDTLSGNLQNKSKVWRRSIVHKLACETLSLVDITYFWEVLRAWCWNENNLRNANKRENFMSGMVGLFVRDSGVTLVGNLLQCAGIRIILHTIWERSTCVTGRYEVIKWISLSLASTETDKSSDSLRNQIYPTFTIEKKTCSYRCCMCGCSFCFFFQTLWC